MAEVREYDPRDETVLPLLWHEAWHFSHADHVPQTMLPKRHLDYFQRIFPTFAEDTRVIGPLGAPVGFYLRLGNYIDRLFVSSRQNGYGTALIDDAETQMKREGHSHGELRCLVENTAARQFYEAKGWQLFSTVLDEIPAEHGGGTLYECIYRKDL